ncbi:pirin family protein [Aquipuribacter nitratireducens]|uniref:Pirin family protein n=1 Tax=Aquipuribacter nitratireducens TaxID=650104 RepID=A0ABW0GR82_9MICO
MSNLDTAPSPTDIGEGGELAAHAGTGPLARVLRARDVPLGGPRAMRVRRTLPSRERTTIGAWCFVDHYGPATGERVMVVPPHPHTGLQTVTWLVGGEALHHDSVGSEATIRPGQLNIMTSGHGIAHGEQSLDGGDPLHGVQLWVALPEEHRHQAPHFEHHAELPVRTADVDGTTVRTTVLAGTFDGLTSPAATYTPLVGAELRTDGPVRLRLPLDPAFEHGLLLVDGAATVVGAPEEAAPGAGDLVDLGDDRDDVEVVVTEPSTLLLLGGAPFGERLVMWWNFVGRTHDEVVASREAWQSRDDRFGVVPGWADDSWLRAPELPNVRLRPRG